MRHLGVLILNPLPFYSRPAYAPQTAFKKLLAFQAVWPFSICGSKSPSFRSPLEGESGNRCPDPRKSHPRVWLPFRCVFQLSNPWKPLSASNAPRLLPSELCSSQVIGKELPLSTPLLRFPDKPFNLSSALQRLAPTWKAVPLYRSPKD